MKSAASRERRRRQTSWMRLRAEWVWVLDQDVQMDLVGPLGSRQRHRLGLWMRSPISQPPRCPAREARLSRCNLQVWYEDPGVPPVARGSECTRDLPAPASTIQ
jgi:hypothetical protein